MRYRFERLLSCLLAASLVVLAGCVPGDDVRAEEAAETPQKKTEASVREKLGSVPAQADTRAAEALSSAFRAAADQALPAVVFVQVEKQAEASPRVPAPFRFFFDDPRGQGEPPPQVGAGSGFVVDGEGHIVTNHHVVSDATRVMVRLLDGREYEAQVVGSDPNTDVAVIRIEPGEDDDEIPRARLGDSESLRVGDWVLALGSPLGLDFSVTAGIVSAKGRQLTGRETALEAFIQTDAAINQGNSGGPLVDLQGRVVGINTAIYGAARFVGYGFAIPVDIAERVVDDLLEYGFVRRPQLGVRVSDVTAVDAEVYGLDEVRGAEVVAVVDDGPAAAAGVELGDVIVSLDGSPLADSTELVTELAELQPGDEVELEIVREGERRQISVELGEFEHADAPAEQTAAERQKMEEVLGFRVEPLTRQLADRIGYESAGGLVVAEVRPFSPAARAGVRPGQLLLAVDRQEVESVDDVESVASELSSGDVVSLRLRLPDFGETIVNYRIR